MGVPEEWEDHVTLLFDLMHLAYQADLTRVITYAVAREQGNTTYENIGVPEGHHECSHHQNNPHKHRQLTKINQYHIQLLMDFLTKLQNTPDGDGSLLDHAAIVYGAGQSDGDLHSPLDLPTLLIGGLGGTIRGNQFLDYAVSARTPMMNLHMALLDKAGVRVEGSRRCRWDAHGPLAPARGRSARRASTMRRELVEGTFPSTSVPRGKRKASDVGVSMKSAYWYKNRMAAGLLALGGAVVFAVVSVAAATQAPAVNSVPVAALPAEDAVAEVVNSYCLRCHSERMKRGGLDLESLDVEHVGANAELWEKVIKKMRVGAMPPAGGRRPDAATYASFIASLEGALDAAVEDAPNPGRPPVHRLNRLQYTNAIRDLFGLEIDGRTMLPADDTGFGFDNIADVLTLSPSFARPVSAGGVQDQPAGGRGCEHEGAPDDILRANGALVRTCA